MRICSLLPSATEIVAELGLVGSLVGISEACDWPPEVRGLPVVTCGVRKCVLVLVVKRLEPARSQDRLAQPLQPKREQQRADDETQDIDRDPLQSRPEDDDEREEHDRCSREPDQGRLPPAYDANAEHDCQRLDQLDSAGEEGAREDQDLTGRHRAADAILRGHELWATAGCMSAERRLASLRKE
jgi:hypothetical protein